MPTMHLTPGARRYLRTQDRLIRALADVAPCEVDAQGDPDPMFVFETVTRFEGLGGDPLAHTTAEDLARAVCSCSQSTKEVPC